MSVKIDGDIGVIPIGNASGVAFTPVGGIQATNVQAAIAEVDADNAGPAFRVTTSIDTPFGASGIIKAVFNTEEFDTNNCFSNNRFTPNVAGYYHFDVCLLFSGGTSVSFFTAIVMKNGSEQVAQQAQPPYAGLYGGLSVSALVYLNGTTDYVEAFGEINGVGNGTERAGSSFSGHLARRA